MKIGIASDHRGVFLKASLVEYLRHQGHEVVDYGTESTDPDTVFFPEYATKLAKGILDSEVVYGIAICGTGIGMSIALNKFKGIYCAKVNSINEAVLCREHNDANVIALSADINLELVKSMVDKFLTTSPSSVERYGKRIRMIKDIEDNNV